ncbi:hypothetical protein B0H19DRAFT_1195582 [Mycena capillaripes]|nr:hypothetical protein B0H19DRAFT_1195582 [Mycena capillaripes]
MRRRRRRSRSRRLWGERECRCGRRGECEWECGHPDAEALLEAWRQGAAPAAGAVGRAVGISVGAPRERTPSAGGSFLKSPTTDAQHDDISAFAKDINAARPLLGRYRQQQQQDCSDADTPDPKRVHDDGADADAASCSSSLGTSRGGTVRGSIAGAGTYTLTSGPVFGGAPQVMLMSADEVDARLRSMNEEFMRHLVGLCGDWRRRASMMHSPASPSGHSGSGSGSRGQSSEEVLGELEFDFEQGRWQARVWSLWRCWMSRRSDIPIWIVISLFGWDILRPSGHSWYLARL